MNAELLPFIQKMLPMPGEKAQIISTFFTEAHFKKNDQLIQAGSVSNHLFILKEGLIRSQLFNVDGDDITTSFYSPVQVVVDAYSFFKRVNCQENFYALTDCKVYQITFEEVQKAFHSMPEFREFGRAMLINAYAQLKQRMLSTLQETAEVRYANLMQTNPDIIQHAPLKCIASYLGVTDTSLSRIRKEFIKK